MRRLVFALAVLGLLHGCATNPVTGKTELTLVSQAQEISIGQEQYLPAVQSQGGYYKVDQSLNRYVQQVGQRVAAVSDSDLPYEFVVVNDGTPNAWALPGGKIAVHRGLLMQLENEAELAAVLGHEVVHAAARHGAKSMERAMLLQGAVMLTAIGVSDNDYANYIVGGASIGAQLISQRYGRDAELESDAHGMRYMAAAGYDPAAAITLQEKFVKLSASRQTSWLDGLFASHPPSQQRVDRNRETYATIAADYNMNRETGKARYDEALTYLRSKQDAYSAFDQATTLLSNKEIDAAMRRVDKAISLEPREARFYGLKADILYNSKDYKAAIDQYSKALSRDEDYFEYYLGRGISYSRLGNRDAARSDLERSNSLLPTALATNELGTIALIAGNRDTAKQYFASVAGSSGPLAESAKATYIRLDIADNPAAYFQVTSERRNGQFFSVVSNRTGMAVAGTVVTFNAVINGKAVSTQSRGGAMAAGGKIGLYPGWKLDADDVVDNVDVRVTAATLAGQ